MLSVVDVIVIPTCKDACPWPHVPFEGSEGDHNSRPLKDLLDARLADRSIFEGRGPHNAVPWIEAEGAPLISST